MADELSSPTPTTLPTDPEEVARLLEERDALRAQLEAATRGRRWGTRTRRIGAVVLVVLFAFSFLASGVGIWLHRSTFNEDIWAERVVPIGEDPQVQAALATWTTDQLMTTVDPRGLFQEALPERAQILATPLSSAVEDYVAGRVAEFFASERFEELWAVAAVKAHEAVVDTLRGDRPNVTATEDRVTINLIPLMNAVLAEIIDAAPGLVGSDRELPDISVEDLPDAARERLARALGVDLDDDFGTLTIYDGGKLAAAQETVRQFDRLVIFATILTIVTAAAALGVSPRRRRTLFQLLGAATLVLIAIRRVTFLLEDEVADLVKVDLNRRATIVVLANFVNPLTDAAATILWVIAAVALVAGVTGPYGWAVRLRATLANAAATVTGALGEGATDTPTSVWVNDHADALRVAGYALGALLLWFAELTWGTILVVAVVIVAWQTILGRLTAKAPATTPAPGD